MKTEITESAKGLERKTAAHAEYLEAHAEAGFELNDTYKYVFEELNKIGLEAHRCGKCGIVAYIDGDLSADKPKSFLLRADMDALRGVIPEDEKKTVHACGHHFHTAMLLSAAELLLERRNEFGGRVILVFQPAEEILEGARDMIESGLFETQKPNGAMMLHVLSGFEIPLGSIIVSSGGVSAPSADFFEIEVQGKGTHGAMAHTGVDAISVSAYIINALHEISSREIPMGGAAALTIGKIEGGKNANVLPDKVNMSGSMRSLDIQLSDKMKKRVVEISQNTAQAFGAKANVTFSHSCPPLVNDDKISDQIYQCLKRLFGKENVMLSGQIGKNEIRGGSDDFAYISQEIPSVAVSVCAGSYFDGYEYPLHNPNVRFDKRALTIGASIYAASALCFLQEN